MRAPAVLALGCLLAGAACSRDDAAPPPVDAACAPTLTLSPATIPTLRTPIDLASPTASFDNAYAGQTVSIRGATGSGQLVVTSVFPDGFALGDTGAPYDASSSSGGFNHVFVAGAPPASLRVGAALSGVTGLVALDAGFSEIAPCALPLTGGTTTAPAPAMLAPTDSQALERLLRLDAATVTLTGTVCPVDTTQASWTTYHSFQLEAVPGVCDAFESFSVTLPGTTLGAFDPVASRGKRFTFVGMLRNHSGANPALVTTTACASDLDCRSLAAAAHCAAGACTLEQPLACTSDGTCTGVFVFASCLDGTCRKGVYNLWEIRPRDASDITPE